jgi:hypothetical protein
MFTAFDDAYNIVRVLIVVPLLQSIAYAVVWLAYDLAKIAYFVGVVPDSLERRDICHYNLTPFNTRQPRKSTRLLPVLVVEIDQNLSHFRSDADLTL